MKQLLSTRERTTKIFRFINNWVVLPVGVLVLLTAEFSRYLVYWEPLRSVLAPRTLLIAMVVTLVVWLILGLWSKNIFLTWSDLWWLGVPLLLGAWSLFGLLWSPAIEARTYLVEFWLYGLVLALFVGIVGQLLKNRKCFVAAAFIGVAVVIGIALIEKITDTHLPLSNLHNPYREQWAVTSVFINQNHLAASLALFLPLFLGAALSYRRLRWFILLVFGSGLVILFFTGSTLAWLGLFLSLVIFGLLELIYSKRIQSKFLLALVLGFLSLGLTIGVWTILPAEIRARFSVAAEGVGKSMVERLELFQVGTKLALEQPLRGLGPAAAEPAVRALEQTRVQNLHSLFLEMAVNFGIPAVVLFVGWSVTLIVRLFRQLKKLAKQEQPEFHRAAALIATLIGLSIIQLVPSTFVGVRAIWIVLGLTLAVARFSVGQPHVR